MKKPTASNDKRGMPTALCRGINMGNALEAPIEGAWGWVIEDQHFDVIKQAGFDHLRIPIRWSTHADLCAPYTIDPKFLNRIGEVVAGALERELTVIINMHHYDELFQQPAAHKERFLAIWQQIAARYHAYPETLYFEILNEPNTALTPELWNQYAQEAYGRIRQTNPQRYIVIDTAVWGSYLGLPALIIPEHDGKLIVSFHFYVPWDFCFQGACWITPPPPVGKRWSGADAERALITEALDETVRWSQQQHNVALWNGEYGVHHWADFESRVLWTQFVTREAEKREIANAIWSFHSSNSAGLYDPQTDSWVEELLHAVLPDREK